MNREWETDPRLGAEEYQALARLAERLERERPLPGVAFRGELRRDLVAPRRRRALPTPRWRALAASYAGAGLLCMAVAAAGLAGVGPFAA